MHLCHVYLHTFIYKCSVQTLFFLYATLWLCSCFVLLIRVSCRLLNKLQMSLLCRALSGYSLLSFSSIAVFLLYCSIRLGCLICILAMGSLLGMWLPCPCLIQMLSYHLVHLPSIFILFCDLILLWCRGCWV
jgi:hypothetical protein